MRIEVEIGVEGLGGLAIALGRGLYASFIC